MGRGRWGWESERVWLVRLRGWVGWGQGQGWWGWESEKVSESGSGLGSVRLREWEGPTGEAKKVRGWVKVGRDQWGWKSERVSESGEIDCVKFKKNHIRNRVLETRFPGGFHVGHPCHIQIVTSHTIGNRVYKTRFPDECQMARMPHQIWSKHENRVFETRFTGPKSSLLDLRC